MGIIRIMKGGYKAANGNYKWLKASECIEYEKRAVVVNEACIKEERSPPVPHDTFICK